MCTRVFIDDGAGAMLTARNMDWFERFNTNLWAFPANVTRYAMPGNKKSYSWKSKYKSIASVITLSDKEDVIELISTTDGLNDQGLVVNTLYLSESDYGKPSAGDKDICMSIWGQFMLDNYACVKDAVEGWVNLHAQIVTIIIPSDVNSKPASQHISLSDSAGNSAIFEYYEFEDSPKLHITTNISKEEFNINGVNSPIHYHENCAIMTNSPVYDQQIKLNYYWEWQWQKEGNGSVKKANESAKTKTLPGTSRSPDRFARVSYYLENTFKSESESESEIVSKSERDRERLVIGQAFSLINTASVPIGYVPNPDEPNISNTLWTTVSDQTNKKYYFKSTDYPNLIWVALDELDLSNANVALKLDVDPCQQYSGNVTALMTEIDSSQFEFFPA
jgi:penicillin V acylase-like amidase (Ntn superfamily)